MKKILLIDNTFDPPHGCPEIRDGLEAASKEYGTLEIVVARAPDSGIPKSVKGFDGAVLSGSKTRAAESAPWIDLEMEAIRELHALRIPTLGICYGEQIIARTFGGLSHVGPAKLDCVEYGWVELERIVGDSPILRGLPEKFFSFEFHQDEVRTLPKNFRLTATSPACPIQAYDVLDAPMWGVQFHPERGIEHGKKSLERKIANSPEVKVINGDRGVELYDPLVAQNIFGNFMAQVWGARR